MAEFSDNARGAMFMSGSMAGFVINDAIMKGLLDEVPLFQAVALRGLVLTVFVVALAWRFGALRALPPARDRMALGLRILGELGGTVCYLTALANMPLANATAILQALPLSVTLAAALLLREPVGWRRWSAIAAGFLGVLMIVRPGAEGFDAYSVWALAAVVFITLRDVATRRLSPATPSLLVTLATTAVITVAALGASAATEGWAPIGPGLLLRLAAAAGMVFCGYFFGVLAMRTGEIAVVSPFRYSILVWALALGWLVFGDVPDAMTLAGAGVIVAAGAYAFARERRLGRAPRVQPGSRHGPGGG